MFKALLSLRAGAFYISSRTRRSSSARVHSSGRLGVAASDSYIRVMQNASRQESFQHGFTLIELLVTISLASILLAIAVPSFRELTIGNRLTTQANEFAAAVQLARSEAIKRNRNVTLCRVASNQPDTCVTSSADWTNWIVLAGNGTVVRRGTVTTAGTGGTRVRSTLTNDTVTFTPDGLASTGSALVNGQNISVCSQRTSHNNFRRVTLGLGSRISTETDSGTC